MTQPALSPHTEQLPGGIAFDMLPVEGGEFLMGGTDEEADEYEKPVHKVKLSSFYLGKYPVTQAIWQSVMGDNPSNFKGEHRPVEQVTWEDAKDFIQKLNDLTTKSRPAGFAYCLPAEAQWKYAARGGKHSEGYLYAGSDKLKQVGWYRENSNNETHEVGQKLANELGLYDMSGNVWEWCEDDWHDNYNGAPTDGSAWVDKGRGVHRVVRGGSSFSDAQDCRAASRYYDEPASRNDGFGFRLALSLQSVG
ncbi:MAG TPA: formylglycine-generating enzyme family protein [Saprospiraceae bacterium]|nr:formylglycine-generating enzyme family protein [Saprospiraceae bacterium]